MELVYLWVEEYKNIKNQGFNFSPRFECEYDEDTNELTIDEKKDCVSIFPDNINVTAIVGENGSGKSSVLRSIISKQNIFVVVYDKELKVYSRNVYIRTSYVIKHLNKTFLKNILYYAIGNKYLPKTMLKSSYINIEKTVELIVDNYLKLEEYSFSVFNFVPESIQFNFKYDYKLLSDDEISDKLISEIKSTLDWNPHTDTDRIYEALHALQILDNEYLNYLLYQFQDITYLFEHINLTEKLHPKDGYLILNIEEIQKELIKCEHFFIDETEFKILKEHEDENIRIKDLQEKIPNYKQLLFQIIPDELNFNFFSENGASFNSLSDGEKTIYTFLVNLINYTQEDFFFFLDEPDNTLHPDWQKRFLNELINILQKLDKKAHILVTSHSPFLLSDLPKENVIFLKKDADEKCKNVTKTTDIETFGANIHTLLSHGFFMKDGLMGEFAKGKIDEAIKILNLKQLSEDDIKFCENIISIVGEPILKRQMQKMLDSKRLTKIDALEAEIELMKHRIEMIRKNQ